ncbi:MAG: aminotransferase class V-fold PLP-dependent enzyme [Lachnospiraceae bacterium]|nr:aminotransferase class V-fold PLP-dependent enzyme [Lachnospiraceae bacterium]
MLDKKLDRYAVSGAYPFHMPGHKRVSLADFDPYKIDITEIQGFDDLHDAHDVIEELQRGYADLYGAKQVYLSVNGSTLGNLAAIFSATDRGDEIIISGGCHRSVLHAAELNGLTVHTIEPEMVWEEGYHDQGRVGLAGRITGHQVAHMLDRHPAARLLVVTSPGYEGIISDIDDIVSIAHERGVLVHIDGAHGAHHGLGGIWEKPIIASNADTVVLSLHKTLPAFTGSSVLLRSADSGVSDEKIDHYLDCFETSSPSYILMYGMAVCLRYIREKGSSLFEGYAHRLNAFYKDTEDLNGVGVCRFDHHDISKIIISSRGRMSGKELADILRSRYSIETELSGEGYCLALSSVMDSAEAFEKLSKALHDI